MANVERPDLSSVEPAVRAYIEALEALLAGRRQSQADEGDAAPAFDPAEAPTTLNVITATVSGIAKRTARHFYERQRRGGMGIFDLEAPPGQLPALLTVVDESHSVLLLTNMARAFYTPVRRLPQSPIRGKGQPVFDGFSLEPGETLAYILPAGRGANVALLAERGFVRVLPAHIVSQNMNPGTALYRYAEHGPLAGACWTSGSGDLFIATRSGQGIRFPERSLPVGGGQGIRLEAGDAAVSVEAVQPPDGDSIFLLGADGRGTIRLMSGFAANKAPGGGGKVAFKTDQLVGAVAAGPDDDIFVISQLSKIIRFSAEEVPAKEGVVQGVVCMSLRGDECAALAASPRAVVQEAV